MLYKTMTLELIQQRPQVYEQLRQHRKLLPALNGFAMELKEAHEHWKEHLAWAKPESDPGQIASEALELALRDLTSTLASEFPASDDSVPMIDVSQQQDSEHSQPA